MDADVLIVGAGPTGLMLANQLARRGVRARIIDRHAGPSLQTRALAVQARTLEIYSHLDIAGRALELGTRASAANLWARGKRTVRIPLGDIGRDLSSYPFVLILGQDDNERILGDSLRRWGITVEWNTELVGLAQEPDRVKTTLKYPDGTTGELAAAWVAGCDGAKSAVRELNGIPFPGAPYEQVFYVADVQATGPMVPGELNAYVWRRDFHLFFPMRGTDHWRLVGILPQPLRGRDDLTFEEVIPAVLGEVRSGISFQACRWFSTYRIHHRCAACFRDRRCFLLGDAAHIHSPVGGQGMNTGLQDAYNLAWKLSLVVSRRAGAALLDSYEKERLPVARRLLRTTDRAFTVLVSSRWLAGLFRTRILAQMAALVMRFGRIQKLAFRTVSQIGIRYRKSPLSVAPADFPKSALRAGDRFPWLRLKLQPDGPTVDLSANLDDTRFNLFTIGQTASLDGAQELGGLLRIHEIPGDSANYRELARARIPRLSFYLVRPDGYVGLAGTYLEAAALTRYLSEQMQMGIKAA